MNLSKNGKLLCDLRKAKGLTQKQVADKLGIVPKTVSKWETGHGFPDVSTVSALADILGVSEKTILSGDLEQNLESANNMKRTKFYVCPCCGSFMHANMISVTDSVMHLDCQWQQPFAVPFKELAHGENRQQELSFIKDIDIESRKLHPGHHGDVEGVGRGSLLGSVAGGGTVLLYIVLIVF